MVKMELEKHRDLLFTFAEDQLGHYVKELESQPSSLDQKEFNDPIWQTIVIQPFEVAILDSPLLQRLRLIRQLGVVHWVCPGATHTRFEHTLGVTHQIQNLISAINKNQPASARQIISTPVLNLMRLIALCHDVGHGVMSHVSENALKDSGAMEGIILDFMDEVKVERAKPSELAAYYIIGSPAFRRLLDVVLDKYREHQLPREDSIPKIQGAIIGKVIMNEIPLLHELINGPFDADKLDYMPRDARMAGVPVVTDIPRLIQKVRAIRVAQEQLPEDVAKGVDDGLPSYVMTGIALSGARTIDELMLGRTLLFDKIYRHQKVRAAESMVAALLENISHIQLSSPAMIPYMFVDDQLINVDRAALEQLAEGTLAGEKEVAARVTLDIARRLRERRLFVRAFAFSQNMPLDPYGAADDQRAGLNRLILEARDVERRSDLVARVAGEVLRILCLLECTSLIEKFPEDALQSYIRIDPPEAPSHGAEVYNAHLIAPNGEVLRFRDETAEARAWTDAYPLARDLGFVFSASELSPYVFIAMEKEVRTEFGIRIPRSMITYTKQSEEIIRKLRRDLDTKGFYDNAPYDIQPVPVRLSRADVRTRLRRLADSLHGYAGPYRAGREEGSGSKRPAIEWERVLDWLRQFSGEDVIDSALDVVTKVRLIGRREIVTAMQRFCESNPEFRGAYICPLGEPKDSSAIYTYLAGDVAQANDLTITTLPEALYASGARPIIFVDDFIGSGGQSVTILEGWLGEKLSRNLGEVRSSLSEPIRAELRQRRLGFVFAAGFDEGLGLLKTRAEELGLSATVAAMIEERSLPVVFPEGSPSPAQEKFLVQCREIGRALLTDGNADHAPEWIEEKVLGYGNRGLLVTFPFNTPAQTLTCLWAEGRVKERHWSPLFPRQKKQ